MLGWKELASESEAFYSILPDSVREATIIYCRNYGQAGALRFYGRHSDFRAGNFQTTAAFTPGYRTACVFVTCCSSGGRTGSG